MTKRTFTPWGALHPILFFSAVYIVALIFSIFICSSLFYSCQYSAKKAKIKQEKPNVQMVALIKK